MKQALGVWRAMKAEQRLKLLGGAFSFLALAAMGVACAVDAHWRSRMIQDSWPLDSSRIMPNIVASVVQALIVSAVLYVIWPRFRAFVNALPATVIAAHKKLTDEQTESLMRHHEQQVTMLHAKLDAHHDDVVALHRHLGTGRYDEPVKAKRTKKAP